MQFELTTLFLVESDAGSWYRFLVTGTVTGGRLKTPADDDSVSPGKVDWRLFRLSSEGIGVPLPDKEREAVSHCSLWGQARVMAPPSGSCSQASQDAAPRDCHPHQEEDKQQDACPGVRRQQHIFQCEINPVRSLHSTLKKYMTEIFGAVDKD